MEGETLYTPENDPDYADPYVDEEGWRDDLAVRCYFVHGGWRATEYQGQHVKFCLYFPEPEFYEGRFFQYLSPAPEDERESEKAHGAGDRIGFALTNGGYFAVSNQGGFVQPSGARCYKANAATACIGRSYAAKLYGAGRPYGYVFGGSGGSFKTMGAIECTSGIWDGAVPYVIANPMSTPNGFCPRMRVMRLLGEKGLAALADRMDAGGSGDLYEGLDPMQREALEEATRLGFPKRGWFAWPYMGDGALSVLMPCVYGVHKDYFKDYWTCEGYSGADPASPESRDHVQFVTTVAEIVPREEPKRDEGGALTVDNSWVATMIGNQKTPHLRLSELPPSDAYLFHARLRVLTGAAAGVESPIESIEDGLLKVSSAFDGTNADDILAGIAVGDRVMIDNGDYLAMQTFQRHQVPDASYSVYDQYRDAEGKPLYPQFPMLISPLIAQDGAGCVPAGNIHCKTIAVCSLLDESAFAWHGDWYRKAVVRATGSEEDFRLYYNDNCVHDDGDTPQDPQHAVSYLGIQRQALLDVVAWVEEGIEPPPTTSYELVDGQVELPYEASERGGLQPVVHAFANGKKAVEAKVGELVEFTAQIEAPAGAGKVVSAAWDYEHTNDFSHFEELELKEGGRSASLVRFHAFAEPGTYFPTISVASSRDGSNNVYVQCRNLDRVRVVVRE